MPIVRITRKSQSPVLAILLSDVHLSLKPPLARSDEPNWFDAMGRVLQEVKNLAGRHKAIVLCAGDIFDKWSSPPELINWALEHFPECYAIPGNHDLPSHRPDLAHRSAYGTLVRAGLVKELGPEPTITSELTLYGSPFGGPVPHAPKEASLSLRVLLTHQYLWVPGRTYYGAPKEARLGRVAREFRGFDVVVVGDNHLGFTRVLKSGTRVINCGTLFRRKTSEIRYRPSVGLLHRNGEVSVHYLDTSQDRITKGITEEQERGDEGVAEFVDELGKVEVSSLSFADNMRKAMDRAKVSDETRRTIMEAMGDGPT